MALVRTRMPDGSYHYRQEPLDPDKPVVFTGPVKGDVTLADGTVYNVSDDYIEVASLAHSGELSHHIGLVHEEDGHPVHLPRDHAEYDPLRDEYHHTCSTACGEVARTPGEAAGAFANRLSRLGYGHLVGTEEHGAVVDAIRARHAQVSEDSE